MSGPRQVGCSECGHTGYLIDQTYGAADIPDGWTPVQRCDTCQTFLDDEDAARAAGAARGAAVEWFEPEREPLGDDYDDAGPGDWAIEWVA